MPFTGDVYSLPAGYLATSGGTIFVSQHNPIFEDLEAAINSTRPISTGGTGATTAAGAVTALGAMSKTTPQLGGTLDSNGEQIRWSKGADVASAAALALGTDGNVFDITGTTTITSINTLAVGTVVILHFDAVLTLTHHATDLVLPGGANITTAAGDGAMFYEYAAGDWRCLCYSKANGEPLVSSASLTQDLDANGNLVKLAKGADVASAASLTLGTDGNYFDITGTTTITSIATLGVGTVVRLHFDAALTLTHHATDLVLPGAADITTAAGDEATFVEYAAGDWRCTNYQVAADAPGSVSGGWAFIEEQTVSGTPPSLNFTDASMGNYRTIKILGYGLQGTTNAIRIGIRLSTNGGSTYISTGYVGGAGYSGAQQTNTTMMLAHESQLTNVEEIWFIAVLEEFNQARECILHGEGWSDLSRVGFSFSRETGTTARDALQIIPTAGNLDAGTVLVFGQ